MAKMNASGRDLLEQMRAAIADAYPELVDKTWDPLISMAVFAANPDLSAAMKFSANREIAQYVYAKRKAVEIEADGEGMRVLLVQFSDKGFIIDQQSSQRIEDHSNGNGTRLADPEPLDVPLAGNAPEQPQDDAQGRFAPGLGDDDLRGDRHLQ